MVIAAREPTKPLRIFNSVSYTHLTQKKVSEKDGYDAVQLGFQDVPERKLAKPEIGHLKKAGEDLKKVLKEFQFEGELAEPVSYTHLMCIRDRTCSMPPTRLRDAR